MSSLQQRGRKRNLFPKWKFVQLTYLAKAHTYLLLSGYDYLAIWYLEETSTAIRARISERLLNKLRTKDLQGCTAFSLNRHIRFSSSSLVNLTEANLIIQFLFACFSLMIFVFSLVIEHVNKQKRIKYQSLSHKKYTIVLFLQFPTGIFSFLNYPPYSETQMASFKQN